MSVISNSNHPSLLDADPKEDQLKLKPVGKYTLSEANLFDNLAAFGAEADRQIRPYLYECALTSECATDNFNGKASVCFPVRDERGRAAFVVELVSDAARGRAAQSELGLVETVIYVLGLCQSELLAEYSLGMVNKQYGELPTIELFVHAFGKFFLLLNNSRAVSKKITKKI